MGRGEPSPHGSGGKAVDTAAVWDDPDLPSYEEQNA